MGVRQGLADAAGWLQKQLAGDSLPRLTNDFATGGDHFRSVPAPTDRALVEHYKDVCYACANLNADAVSAVPLRLYVATATGQRKARLATKSLSRRAEAWIKSSHVQISNGDVEEVTEHPAIDLLNRPNSENGIPLLSRNDLFSLTQLFQEIVGKTYWLISLGSLGIPESIWLLHSQYVEPTRKHGSTRILDHYEYRAGRKTIIFQPEEVIPFRTKSLTDPYVGGVSPLRAAFARTEIVDKHLGAANALLNNNARPDLVISPTNSDGVIGKDEKTRLERVLSSSFGGRNRGGIYISRDSLKLDPLTFPPRDLNELTESNLNAEHVARIFGVPLSMLNRDSNRASAEEGRQQHAKDTVLPRLRRIEDALNSRLIPLYDETKRLFFAFDNPVQEMDEQRLQEMEVHARIGVRSINEFRAEIGLEPVPWGDRPWIPLNMVPAGLSPFDKPKEGKGAGAGAGASQVAEAVAKMSPRDVAIFAEASKQLSETGKISQSLVDSHSHAGGE